MASESVMTAVYLASANIQPGQFIRPPGERQFSLAGISRNSGSHARQ